MNKTGGILLAGGSGSRLFPNTKIANKHLLPIYDKPMIFYSLSILLLCNIKNITIVCNKDDKDGFEKILGKGEMLGLNLEYSIQDSPLGIPDAISNALDSDSIGSRCLVFLNLLRGDEPTNLFVKPNSFKN